MRISKTVNGESTTHVLDGVNVVADITNGNVSKYNRRRGLISIEQNGHKGYYTFNGHGDVTGIVDSNGDMKKQTWFYAYGYEIYQTDTVFDNPFRYCGEYTDEEIKKYINGEFPKICQALIENSVYTKGVVAVGIMNILYAGHSKREEQLHFKNT